MLKLFVYGTLKRGYRNHDQFCGGALEIREAQVCGRLYDGPGFPVLEVPGEDVLACGTADPIADVGTQTRLSGGVGKSPRPVPGGAETGDWGTVHGELLTFGDPESRLPAIDRLEGFRPDGRSLYRRVLVVASVCGCLEPAWVYILASTDIKQRRILSGRWPVDSTG
ncbi:MAG: gamma-glutamylcyclotransferase [Candidatus Aminicenantes bacterium]|nr:gamma-glutamylcyclotransferase [Candidatus Aminicenantes bacterium]